MSPKELPVDLGARAPVLGLEELRGPGSRAESCGESREGSSRGPNIPW